MRIFKLENLWGKLLWFMRILRSKTIFQKSVEEWILFADEDPTGQSEWGWNGWLFLRPYFASRGYTLYDQSQVSSVLSPRPDPALASSTLRTYPYARTIPDDCQPGVLNMYTMIYKNPMVWGARDTLGRDVVIKIISDANNPSFEWLVLQKLNGDELRRDSANRTIHIIEFMVFDNLVFVVMPRWDCAFDPPFTTVSELMEVTKEFLGALEFLHKHRIAHMDIRSNNCGMNMYAGFAARRATTIMRRSNEVRYILYDFGYSLIYPADTDITTVSIKRHIHFSHAPSPKGPYNPFKADVSMMGGLLSEFLMHAAKTVPEIEPFLYRMMELDENKRLSASEAQAEFMALCEGLMGPQLQTPVDARWNNGFETRFVQN